MKALAWLILKWSSAVLIVYASFILYNDCNCKKVYDTNKFVF